MIRTYCVGSILRFLDACSDQAEDVSPKRIKIGFGCSGIRLLPLWFLALHQLGCTKFVRLILVSAVSPFPVFVFRMFSNLMQRLLSWRFNRRITVSPASLSAEKRSLCLPKEKSKRSISQTRPRKR